MTRARTSDPCMQHLSIDNLNFSHFHSAPRHFLRIYSFYCKNSTYACLCWSWTWTCLFTIHSLIPFINHSVFDYIFLTSPKKAAKTRSRLGKTVEKNHYIKYTSTATIHLPPYLLSRNFIAQFIR